MTSDDELRSRVAALRDIQANAYADPAYDDSELRSRFKAMFEREPVSTTVLVPESKSLAHDERSVQDLLSQLSAENQHHALTDEDKAELQSIREAIRRTGNGRGAGSLDAPRYSSTDGTGKGIKEKDLERMIDDIEQEHARELAKDAKFEEIHRRLSQLKETPK